ncbi:MAG: hypothetical protein RMI01_10670, partial [Thermodesulfovibrio sp.]|nr:hypothetical protein [Thermodesulfovibrio sp.]
KGGKGGKISVSIPYRYSTNYTFIMLPIEGYKVSIPYRYSTNYVYISVKESPIYLFQSLIGTLQTSSV